LKEKFGILRSTKLCAGTSFLKIQKLLKIFNHSFGKNCTRESATKKLSKLRLWDGAVTTL